MKLFVLARTRKSGPPFLDKMIKCGQELAEKLICVCGECTIMKCFDMDMDGYE